MSDRPILFSGPMIRALLDGRKTQARRVLTRASGTFGSAPTSFWEHGKVDEAWPDPGLGSGGYLHVPCHVADDADTRCQLCDEMGWAGTVHRFRPRVRIGDRLWVREAWQLHSRATDFCTVVFAASVNASWTEAHEQFPDTLAGSLVAKPFQTGWRPSIHMPRWASRRTLHVTDVRVERLQEISRDDVAAEGFGEEIADVWAGWHEPFARSWDGRHGAGAWDRNDFVAALTFAVHHANIDALPAPAAEREMADA